MTPTARYLGLDRGAASRAASALIRRADRTGAWLDLPEALAELRSIIAEHDRRALDDAEGPWPGPEYLGLG